MRGPLATALALAMCLGACSGPAWTRPRPSPSDPLVALYRAKFLQACETDPTPARANYCTCTEDALEAHFDIRQLNAVMRNPRLRGRFAHFTQACAKAAGLTLRNPH